MNIKRIIIFLISIMVLFAMAPFVLANNGQEELLHELSIPGTTQGTGTFFEITDSEYLNVSLESAEEITILLESVPKTISLNIEASSIANSTQLIFGNLEPNTTYYKFEDSYKNKVIFVSDNNGEYTWTQDLTSGHHIWFQPNNGTVYLPEDCSTVGTWNGTTSTCTLTQDLFESVEITQNDFILDCDNHTITGDNTGYGIYSNSKSGVTIKNCNITNFSYGMFFNYLSNSILSGNTIRNNHSGIYAYRGSSNNIIANIIKENQNVGFVLHHSYYNNIEDNQILDNSTGLYLWAAKNVFVDNNNIENNITGIAIHAETTNSTITNNTFADGGILVGYYTDYQTYNNTIENNTINGNPIVYLENKSNQVIGNAGQVILIDCDSITVKDVEISNIDYGINLIGTNNSTIDEVEANLSLGGICLSVSSGNTISNSDFSDNRSGIEIFYSSDNMVVNNKIDSNTYGLWMFSTQNNTLKNNTISNSLSYALHLSSLNNNSIYHNNFLDNTQQARLSDSENFFDNGYPDNFDPSLHGGNYWSNYTGTDEKSGSNQDQLGSDGIGDTHYIIYGGHAADEDRYPFMEQDGWGAVVCGDGVCEEDETFENCYQDCSVQGIEKYFPYYKFSLGEMYHPTSFYFDNDADVENNRENYEAGQGDWIKPYVYAHTVEDENYFTIQYWKYEVYNKYKWWRDHNHDWDATIFVVFEKNDLRKPIEVRFARHYFMGIYPWSRVTKINTTYPVVYVAEGSHGGYYSGNVGDFDDFEVGGLIYSLDSFNYYKVGNCVEEVIKWINGEQRTFCEVENELLKGEEQNEPTNRHWPNHFDDLVPWKPENAPIWAGERWNQTRPTGIERVLEFKIACPVDLHIYDSRDRHIGINYETNEPEIEISNAIFRQEGDKQYIMIANPIKGDYRVEIVGTDDGEYDFTMVASEDMKLIEIQEKENIQIAKDEVQTFTVIGLWEGPREIKEKTIDDLELIENNDRIIKRNIQKAISLINKSLNGRYWIDDAHLDSKQGRKVFNYELRAVVRLKLLERLINNDNQSLDIIKNANKKLTKADYLLAETTLNETKEIDIENHRFKRIIEKFIAKAERELIKAKQDLENNKSAKSIIHSKKSWFYSQMAIKFANKE